MQGIFFREADSVSVADWDTIHENAFELAGPRGYPQAEVCRYGKVRNLS